MEEHDLKWVATYGSFFLGRLGELPDDLETRDVSVSITVSGEDMELAFYCGEVELFCIPIGIMKTIMRLAPHTCEQDGNLGVG